MVCYHNPLLSKVLESECNAAIQAVQFRPLHEPFAENYYDIVDAICTLPHGSELTQNT